MSLNKAIKHGKEHRRNLITNNGCRPHGGCRYCLSNRMHSTWRKMLDLEQQVKEWLAEDE